MAGWRARPRAAGPLVPGAARRKRLGAAGLIAALAVCLVALLGGQPRGGQARAPHVYGADDSRMLAAVQAAQWPQQVFNWCGVATVAAIANYRGASVSQSATANYLNSAAAVSPWGTPSYIYPGPAFKANIARDSGTDPRSLAAGLAGMGGGRYHALADPWGSWDATIRLAADLAYSGQPISVIVDHGLHSVVVSKIYANDDPVRNPGSIYALEVWDPGYGSAFDAGIQNGQRVVVSINAWLWWSVYWGSPYEQNGNWDPDPAVGPYTYDPSQGNYHHLWIGKWVYIQPWGPAVSVDWSVDQHGYVIPGQHGELPPGYVLPTPTPVPGVRVARSAPTTIPPSPTPIQRRDGLTGSGDNTQPPAIESLLTTSPSGASVCLGPYCLRDINLWWLAVGGALLLLSLSLLASAALAQRRYSQRLRRRAALAPPGVTVTEVASETPLTLAEVAGDGPASGGTIAPTPAEPVPAPPTPPTELVDARP